MNEVTPIRLAIPWGSFGLNGEWEPNPRLKMGADEQRRRNIANGYLPAPPASDSVIEGESQMNPNTAPPSALPTVDVSFGRASIQLSDVSGTVGE